VGALCPSTTDADAIREWLAFGAAGVEGVLARILYERGLENSRIGN
jgi:hypothetical protein